MTRYICDLNTLKIRAIGFKAAENKAIIPKSVISLVETQQIWSWRCYRQCTKIWNLGESSISVSWPTQWIKIIIVKNVEHSQKLQNADGIQLSYYWVFIQRKQINISQRYASRFVEASFTSQDAESPVLSMDSWMDKEMRCICATTYYLTIKRMKACHLW